MTKENPLVSVIVRTKDRPKLLKRALQSISEQIYRPIEVVLVNDGGCDLEVKELESILKDVSLNYIRLENNTGRAHAGNVGIENVKGDYVGFLDDDDEFYSDHLQVLTEKLLYSPLRIAYTDAETLFIELYDEDKIIEKFKYVAHSEDFSPEILLVQNYIPFMCLLFNKEVFSQIRFDEDFEIFEDWGLLIKLSQKYWFEHIKKVTAKYIQWSDESQINRRALSEDFSKEAYKRVLDQNVGKISSDVIYAYCVSVATERKKFLNELAKKETEYFRERFEIANEMIKVKSEKLRIEAGKQRAEAEKKRAEEEKQRTEAEKEKLLQELMGLRNYFMDLSTSLSWKTIERYRRLKDKVVPLGTKRRAFYDLMLKSVKVIGNEGLKGFSFRVKRRSHNKPSYLKSKMKLKKIRKVKNVSDSKIPEMYNFAQKPVHIIMPVYNGYEFLRNCIDSVFRNTDLLINTLLIIDDKSTDSLIHEYLARINDNDGKRIKVLYNHTNSGFVKTINRGMKLSPEDVIILNSDTVVTKDWVNKLQRAAYSKPRVATATPLSNYMTINGIPKPFQYNSIPDGMDIDAFAEFLEKISLRYYPEIPAGVGFCMYIKRSVLDDVGYFDEERFGKGYAEETDFCMRAFKKGYIHVIDDSSYVYHVGGVSFESVKDPEILKEKNLMIERNLEILKALHPEYMSLVENALLENLAPIHEFINLRMQLLENNLESSLCDRSKA